MKENHKTFIIEMIKHGDKTRAYQKAYPNCTDEHSARKSAERLLRHHPETSGGNRRSRRHIFSNVLMPKLTGCIPNSRR